MSPPSLKEFLQAGGVTPEILARIAPALTTAALRKGETLTVAGQKATHLGFLESGLVKLHGTDTRGSPFVVEFASGGEFVSDFSAMVQDTPARLTVEALEDSVVSSVPFAFYQEAVRREPALHELARRVLEDLVIKLSNREFQFLTMDAKERYLSFMEHRREIAGRVSRNDLAAYLGITPVSLSRIRAQVLRERRSAAT
jgi:CRP-like cAMP-binding protein